MYCPKCGKEIDAGAGSYCPNCGAVLSVPEEKSKPSANGSKKKGLWIGLICGGAVLVAAVAVALILWVFPAVRARMAGPAPVSLSEKAEPIEPTTAAKKSAKKTTAKKAIAKKTTAKKTAAKKTTVKKTTAKAVAKTTTAAKPAKAVDLYTTLKNFVLKKGESFADTCTYSQSSDHYGGSVDETVYLNYWSNSDQVDFCLCDNPITVEFHLCIPKSKTGTYEYYALYHDDTEEDPIAVEGTITAADFTRNYPLKCTRYDGPSDERYGFLETSRVGLCDLLDCVKQFTEKENVGFSFSEFGFQNF